MMTIILQAEKVFYHEENWPNWFPHDLSFMAPTYSGGKTS